MPDWPQDNPFYLLIVAEDGHIKIDLDEPGWAKTYRDFEGHDWLRRPSKWYLVHKETDAIRLAVFIADGDQPYYTARHIGFTGSAGGNEIIAYGIGKKTKDGQEHRLWQLPSGLVVGAEDCDVFGMDMLRILGIQTPPPQEEPLPA